MQEAFNAKARKVRASQHNNNNKPTVDRLVDLTKYERMQRYLDIEAEQNRENRPNALTNTLMESNVISSEPFILSSKEDKGDSIFTSQKEDQYEKYDPEPNADQYLINNGAIIIHSEITLTDKDGNNTTYVRRNPDTQYY